MYFYKEHPSAGTDGRCKELKCLNMNYLEYKKTGLKTSAVYN